MCHIILCGYKGCGKSTWGRLLAKRTGRMFFDLDDQLPDPHSVGLEEFRRQERQAATRLELRSPTVVATGGGAVCDPDSARHLQALGLVVYLRVEPEILLRRLIRGRRPLFLDPRCVEESFWCHYEKRAKIYQTISSVVVEGLCGE